jgi:hypothetical protein
LRKLADDYEATLERVRSQRSACSKANYPDFHLVSPAFPTPCHPEMHSTDQCPARPSTPPETPPLGLNSSHPKSQPASSMAGPVKPFLDSPFATHKTSQNMSPLANATDHCDSPLSTESSYQLFRSPRSWQAVDEAFLNKSSPVHSSPLQRLGHDGSTLAAALQEIQELRKQLAQASVAPLTTRTTAVQCEHSPKEYSISDVAVAVAVAPVAPPRAPPPPPPLPPVPQGRKSAAKAPPPPPLPPTSSGSSKGPSRAPTPPPPPLPKHNSTQKVSGKVPVDAHARAFCQSLRPPDAAPEDSFDYRKAHWERSRALKLGVWDTATSNSTPAGLEANVIDDHLLSLCVYFTFVDCLGAALSQHRVAIIPAY